MQVEPLTLHFWGTLGIGSFQICLHRYGGGEGGLGGEEGGWGLDFVKQMFSAILIFNSGID